MMHRIAMSCLVLFLGACLIAEEPNSGGTFKLTDEEQKLFELTNKERARHDLPPFKVNPLLAKAAREHSENMASQDKLSHVLDGKTPADRVKATGYVYRYVGENVAWGLNIPLEQTMADWMNSKGHRENILKKEFTEIGLGYAKHKDGKFYCTQVFGTPRAR